MAACGAAVLHAVIGVTFMKKHFFNRCNTAALKTVDKYKNIIYSYLEAVPDSGAQKYNNITTIPVSERNESNGYSNFKFNYNEYVTDSYKRHSYCNVRVENNVFNGLLSIKASKASSLKKADLIIFTNPACPEVLYAAHKKLNNDNSWLDNKSLRRVDTVTFDGLKSVTYYSYNIETLWRLGHIIQIYQDKALKDQGSISILHNDYKSTTGDCTKTIKGYKDYGIDLSHIDYVQYDGRESYTYYFGYAGYEYTSVPSTLPGVVNFLKEYTSATPRSIYQKLYKVLTKNMREDKAFSCKIKLDPSKIDMRIDPSIINDDNEIEIYVTTSPEYRIEDHIVENKTADMKAYQKAYQKVILYLKRHDGLFNPKWTEEERKIAENYLSK